MIKFIKKYKYWIIALVIILGLVAFFYFNGLPQSINPQLSSISNSGSGRI